MKRRFVTCDVFTSEAFGGNPLAVVLDAEGLDADAMQRIAREFNLSETTFVLPPADPANTAGVRIFTPARELPFAGHPNVGTAFVLAGEQGPGDGAFRFEEKAGLVAIDLIQVGEEIIGARLTAPQTPEIGRTFSPEAMAACIGLTPGDIETARHEPVLASAGMAFPIAQVTDREALRRAKPDAAAMESEADMGGHVFIYATDDGEPGRVYARMFAPGLGITEDPATGGAAAALAGLLGGLEGTDGTFAYAVTQGVEMGRPSLIETAADVSDGQVTAIRVGGRCVEMMRGQITG